MAKGGRLVMDRALISGSPDLKEVVYCYQFPSRRDRIKIGYSSRGLKRIVEQSTGFPENPEVLFVIHHPRAAEIEKDLHASLADKQAPVLGVEWFEASLPDVLKVSPLLRKAARKERWRSIPRLFLSGAMFGLGVFMLPILSLLALEIFGYGGRIASLRVGLDYLSSPFDKDLNPMEIGRLVVEYLSYSGMPSWGSAIIYASPAVWAGLAYVSLRKQVA